MVLDYVSGGTNAVVVSRSAANTNVLGHRDLYVVDELAAPDRLKELVGEPQSQEVLNGFLAEVVVDSKYRVRRKDPLDNLIEFFGTLQIAAKRFLHHHPSKLTLGSLGKPCPLELV